LMFHVKRPGLLFHVKRQTPCADQQHSSVSEIDPRAYKDTSMETPHTVNVAPLQSSHPPGSIPEDRARLAQPIPGNRGLPGDG
jgi:hypothetical protein